LAHPVQWDEQPERERERERWQNNAALNTMTREKVNYAGKHSNTRIRS